MKNENLDWTNSLRVVATFSMIFLHVAAELLYPFGRISNLYWWTGNIYDSMVRFCVPIFLMISGALIFTKTYRNTQEYLKKRVLRILFPFLFWSLIYILYNLISKFYYLENWSFIDILKVVFDNLKTGASFHLWYIYMIIGIYLFFPIIGKWLKYSTDNEIRYFLVLWLTTIFIDIPFLNKLIPNINVSYFSGYIGYPILGYYLNMINIDFNHKKRTCFLLVSVGILVTVFGTYFATKHNGSFYEGFYSYLSPNVLLVSIGVFLFFKDFVRFKSRCILFFNKYTYGTYLVHVLVLIFFKKIGLFYDFIHPIIGIPIIAVLCFIVSTLIIWAINNLPFGKYISG